MLRFSEEIILLLLDDNNGKFIDLPAPSIECALADAVLMDLALEGRIDTDPERLFLVDPTPLNDHLLDPTLALIAQSTGSNDTRHWIEQTTVHAAEIRDRSLARLIARGILSEEDDRFLWVFQTRRYPVVNNRSLREVKQRIMGVLFSDEIPDARDIVIISLADTCGLFRGLFAVQELERVAPRIEQVRKIELMGREVSKAVRHIDSSLAARDRFVAGSDKDDGPYMVSISV